MQRVLVIGTDDVGRRACAALRSRGVATTHLADPSDAELRAALSDDVDGVAVLLHDDIRALRYSLVVEHARHGIRLFVAMFDRTARAQLESAIPNAVVLSPSSVAVPGMVAAAIAPSFSAIRRLGSSRDKSWVGVRASASGADIEPYSVPGTLRRRGIIGRLRGQLRPYDSGSAVLLGGALGLLVLLVVDTLVGLRHAPLVRALYDAARTTATIGAPDPGDDTVALVWSTISALLVMGFTAAFAAGIVHHLISGRHVALVGRRAAPRSGHVVITGMGQVGLRLAQELRQMGVAVLGVERYRDAPGLSMARDFGIPVIVGDAASRRVLRRAGLGRAVALVAAASEERDNIAVAVSALAESPTTPIVLRAGADDAIDETRSLFHIGPVIDVNGLTAAVVAQSMMGDTPYAVVNADDELVTVDNGGAPLARCSATPTRCAC